MRWVLCALVLSVGCRESQLQSLTTDADKDGFASDVDCHDGDPAIFPGAAELCDGIDNDCNGVVDDPYATDATEYFADVDRDGYGDGSSPAKFCARPDGYVADDTDCDDLRADIHPGAAEADCTDDTDYNCDGSSGLVDADHDGYAACEDCDDGVGAVNPGQVEQCDALDNDCDTVIDEAGALGERWFYADDDEDGFGDPTDAERACDAPDGYVTDARDCNDANDAAHPGHAEVCDGIDNDCDQATDEDATDATTWYVDADGDGYGSGGVSLVQCFAPSGFVADHTDCDDAHGTAHPNGTEICDLLDNDCDDSVDEGFVTTWYADGDHDGAGNPAVSVSGCTQPAGFVATHTDCDDTHASVYQGATEVCDDLDNDCNTTVDDGFDKNWYADADQDGFGAAAIHVVACAAPDAARWSHNSQDCDDAHASAHPGGTEVCDGVNNDCDADTDEGVTQALYADGDHDGYGTPLSMVSACGTVPGFVPNDDDCDDTTALARPGEVEVCDGLDNDCANGVDDGYDTDQDGVTVCGGDCDDDDDTRFPGNTELCDAVDHNCNGLADDVPYYDRPLWYLDFDRDGYGVVDVTTRACTRPDGFTANHEDCDDRDLSRFPGAPLACDGRDADCDGHIDNDADSDGFADESCGGDDCNDASDTVYPIPGGICSLGVTCADVQANGYDVGNDYYLVDPDGFGGNAAIVVWCDMAGGGWTWADQGVPFKLTYTGGPQTLVTPDIPTTFRFKAYGASAGSGVISLGGDGGVAWGDKVFDANQTLQVNVGGRGTNAGCGDCSPGTGRAGGWNGGGRGVDGGSGGGGATDVRWPATGLTARILVAGGGGGCGGGGPGCDQRGGHGGGLSGETGPTTQWNPGGGGGSQTAGGTSGNASSAGVFGAGGWSVQTNDEGGGGGGWYGGSAGGNHNATGGGGSSYVAGMDANSGTTIGGNQGNGYLTYIYR